MATRVSNQRFNPYPNWEDLRFPAQGINPRGGGTADPDIDTTDGMLLFDDARQEVIAGVAQMPHSWAEGSAVHAHIHWIPTDETAGNVVWKFDYEVFGNGTGPTGTYTEVPVTLAADGYSIDEMVEIDMTGAQVSYMILWRLSRMGADAADTYAEDVKLYELDFHYLIDSLGSEEEYSKYTMGE